MKKVMIYAYTASNLGDDLFIDALCSRYPKTNFTLYAPKRYKETFRHLANVNVIKNDTLIQKAVRFLLGQFKQEYFFRELLAKMCDHAVYIGGSLFIEQKDAAKTIRNLGSMAKHPSLYIIGANFGPYKTSEFFTSHEDIFAKLADICFRDKKSYDLFKHLPQVRYAPDVLFNEPTVKNKTKNIVISVISLEKRPDLTQYTHIYYKKIAELASFLIKRGFIITFMSFCQDEHDNKAIDMIRTFIPAIQQPLVTTYNYTTNITSALRIIQQAEAIVATRFHAMILGWNFSKAVLPIIYSEKTKNVLQDGLFPGKYVEIATLNHFPVEALYKLLLAGHFDTTKLAIQSEKQFDKLDDILE